MNKGCPSPCIGAGVTSDKFIPSVASNELTAWPTDLFSVTSVYMVQLQAESQCVEAALVGGLAAAARADGRRSVFLYVSQPPAQARLRAGPQGIPDQVAARWD